MANWKKLKEGQVQVVYQCLKEGCECENQTAEVDPSWHEENGTPMCNEGNDMSYMHTMINDFGHKKVTHDFATVEIE